jgi:hypothetical protein
MSQQLRAELESLETRDQEQRIREEEVRRRREQSEVL